MPCIKCSNGKWKYGVKGRCVFKTLQACKDAAAAIHAKPKGIFQRVLDSCILCKLFYRNKVSV